VATIALVNGVVFFTYDLPGVLVKAGHYSHTGGESPLRVQSTVTLKLLWQLAWLALPLGIVGMLDSLNVNIPRYFVEVYNGQTQLGYFSALSYVPVAGNTVITALADAARPRLANYFVESRRTFLRLVYRLLALTAAIGSVSLVVAIIFGKQILTLLYRSQYAEYVSLFQWLVLSAAIWYMSGILYTALTAARAFVLQPVIFLSAAVTTALLCAIFVPSYGLLASAWAIVGGMSVRFVVSAALLYRTVNKQT
jgi:O-antigen/teichoic acid export membrane protein